MVEKVGRNDLCHCGSGKKYKNCCLQKEQQKKSPLGGRKFTAKVISGGTKIKPESQAKPSIDYNTLMERSFGNALHEYEDKPPVLSNPSEYLVQNDKSNEENK